MKIENDSIRSVYPANIIKELESIPELMEEIRAHGLRGGDFLSAIMHCLLAGEDVDTSDFWDIN